MSVVGFDLGNEKSVVAVARQGGIEVVLNDQSNRETPGIECYVAMKMKNSVSQIKRWLGRQFNDPELQRDKMSLPFSVTEGPDGYPLIHVRYLGGSRTFTPTEILGMVLSNLKCIAEKNLNAEVVDCCIGIPVYFTDLQRRAVLDAATIAGLHPLHLIHETTATALAYGIYKTDLPENDQLNVAFVDIGHASMQVCIAGFKKGQLKVLAHSFDRSLGGRDFDEVLFQYFAAKFKEEYKIDVYQSAWACRRLRTAVEELKKMLSANPEAPLSIMCLMNKKDVSGFIKRDEFEQISVPILERVKRPLEKALADAGLTVDDVHKVEVVGSGSHVPAIIKILTEFFKKKPRRTMNASECVAIGSALECAILSPTYKVREFQVNESFPFPIALSWKGAASDTQNGAADNQQNTILFTKGNSIPSVRALTFWRSSTFSVDVQYADVNEWQAPAKISTYTIGPYQSTKRFGSKVKVKARLNLHGIVSIESATLLEAEEVEVHVSKEPAKEDTKMETDKAPSDATTPSSNEADVNMQDAKGTAEAAGVENGVPESADKPVQMETDTKVEPKKKVKKTNIPVTEFVYGGMLAVDVQKAVEEFEMALQDRVMEETKDRKNAVEAYVNEMRDKLSDKYQDFVTNSEREELTVKLQEVEDWLYEDGKDETKRVYIAVLEELKKQGDLIEERYKKYVNREAEIDQFVRCINSYREAAMSNDPRFDHIVISEKQKVLNECVEAEAWLREKKQQQDSLPKYANPALLCSDVFKKIEAVDGFCKPIMMKPRPAPAMRAAPKTTLTPPPQGSAQQSQDCHYVAKMSVVGFDLGNEKSVVAVARQGGIEVVLNDQSNRETPGIECYVAMKMKNSVSQIKRWLGRQFNDPELQRDKMSLPFSVTEGPDGYPLIHVRYLGGSRTFTPTEILGMVLSNLKCIAEKNLNAEVVDCCIGIPVYFTDLQRRAVLDAATIAGLHPLHLIHETTATALAYGIYKTDLPENDQLNVAFVDIGHASMQVCIAGFKKGQLKVLAHSFDRSLGGRDFDEVLFQYFAAKFKEEYKIDVYQSAWACRRLRTAVEELKKMLSANPEAPLSIMCLMNKKDVSGFIKRDEFEQISVPILERVKRPLEKALADAGLTVDDVHKVEVVGSGSHVPAIIKILTEFFKKKPRRTMNASECVAIGSALECAILSPTYKVREFQVNESFPFPIALSWKGAASDTQNGAADNQQNTILFTKGNSIPSVRALTFWRSSTFSVDVQYADVNEWQAPAKISTYTIGPYQSTKRFGSKVKVKARLNLHGIVSIESATLLEAEEVEVHVSKEPAKEDTKMETDKAPSDATTPSSNEADVNMQDAKGTAEAAGVENGVPESADKPVQMETDTKVEPKKKVKKTNIPVTEFVYGGMLAVDVQKAVEEFEMALQDRVMEETKDRKNAVEAYVNEMRDKLSDKYQDFVTNSEREELTVKLQEVEDWLYEDGKDETKRVYIAVLEELKKQGDLIEERYKKYVNREAEIDQFVRCINSYREAAMSNDPRFDHIVISEKQKVLNECVEAEAWLREKKQQQDSLPKYANPALLCSDVFKKIEAVDGFCKPIMMKPRPAPAMRAAPKTTLTPPPQGSAQQSQDCHYVAKMSVVGFDLGNEKSVVAFARQGGIEVVLNDYSDRETPGIECYVAMKMKNSVSQIKRWLGRQFNDPELQRDKMSLPFFVTEGPDGYPLINVWYLQEHRRLTPAQVLGMVLSGLKGMAEKNLNAAVVDCCIGIPVYFTDFQRRAVLDAATIAGLHPLRLIHETTATALAYGIYKTDLPENDQLNVAFVDIGHASMQVCIAGFKKGQLKVLAHSFDRSLGGKDFDEVLFQHFAAKFKEEYKIDVYQSAWDCLRLRTAVEKLKKMLSANPEAPLNIGCLMDKKNVRGFIKRDEFEQISAPILECVKRPLEKALADAGLTVDDVHTVEVVGSGSRVPAIIKILTEFFKKEPRRTMNETECVARGCALECAILSPTYKVWEFQLLEAEEVEVRVSKEPAKEDNKMETDEAPSDAITPSSNEADVNMQDAKGTAEAAGVENGVPESADKPVQMETDTKQGDPIEERYIEYVNRGAVIDQFIRYINSYREAAVSSDPRLDHIDISEKQKVLNECVESEAWLREKKLLQDSLPKYANPVLLSSDVFKKTEAVDGFCRPIMTKPRAAPAMPAAPKTPPTPPPQGSAQQSQVMVKRAFTHSEVVSITSDFKNFIGEGGFGKVFLGTLDGTQVAVKCWSTSSRQGDKEFRAEAYMMVHHKNLVSLIGYCDEVDKMVLIYEYMGNGNLRKVLSEESTKNLTWERRLKIALDAARGLEYLHDGCRPPIVHRDVKTSNILLDENWEAKLADFGLSRVFPIENVSYVSTEAKGTNEYLDPEYSNTKKLTKASDIFSFGVVLLELVTGRPPKIREAGPFPIHIFQWVNPLYKKGDIGSIVDPRLCGTYNRNSVVKVIKTALTCIELPATQRPNISEVYVALKESQKLQRMESENTSSRIGSGIFSRLWRSG